MSNNTAYSYTPIAKGATPLPRGKCSAIYVGGSGDLYLKDSDSGAEVLFRNVMSGVTYPFEAMYVTDATTATDLVACYA